jgi:hypothetical protein
MFPVPSLRDMLEAERFSWPAGERVFMQNIAKTKGCDAWARILPKHADFKPQIQCKEDMVD